MNPETTDTTGSERAEVTLSFLVRHLPFYVQEQFIAAMDRECFGIAREGTYRSLTPVRLKAELERTATFTFTTLPSGKERASEEVAHDIQDALAIAQQYKAYLLYAINIG